MRRWNKTAVTWAAVLALSACGGGGGSSSSSDGSGATTAVPAPPATGTAPAAVPAATLRQVQGTVLFESIPALSSGGLDYAGVTRKPARGVMFELLDASGKAVANGVTDALGRYAVQVLSGTSVTLRVYAALASPDGRLSAGVYDNTAGGALMGVRTLPFTVAANDQNRIDALLRSGWSVGAFDGKPSVSGDRLAAPFAIVDTLYRSRSAMLAAAPDLAFPELIVFWSASNTESTVSSPAAGQVGPTSYRENDGKRYITLHGKPDVDTDEYDASVIAHEWGHYFQHAFSRSDSPGGSHGPGDLLDRSLAFAEGWGTAWSGIALGIGTYSDSFGPAQADGLIQDLAVPPSGRAGWFNEASVAHGLWKSNQATGLAPIVQALRGPLRSAVASAGIHAFQASLRTVAPAAAAGMASLLQSQSISSVADAWGIGETNDGGLPIALPMVQALVAGKPTGGVCVSSLFDPHADGNKLGSRAYLRFSIGVAGSYRFDLQGAAGSDPDWAIADASGVLQRSTSVTPGSDSATLSLAAGDYLMAVSEHQSLVAPTCFTATFQ